MTRIFLCPGIVTSWHQLRTFHDSTCFVFLCLISFVWFSCIHIIQERANTALNRIAERYSCLPSKENRHIRFSFCAHDTVLFDSSNHSEIRNIIMLPLNSSTEFEGDAIFVFVSDCSTAPDVYILVSWRSFSTFCHLNYPPEFNAKNPSNIWWNTWSVLSSVRLLNSSPNVMLERLFLNTEHTNKY